MTLRRWSRAHWECEAGLQRKSPCKGRLTGQCPPYAWRRPRTGECTNTTVFTYPSHIIHEDRLPISCFLRSKAISCCSETQPKHVWITGQRLWSRRSGCQVAPLLTGTATCPRPEASTCWSLHSWPRWPMMWPLPWPNKACESEMSLFNQIPSTQSTIVPFIGVTVDPTSLRYLMKTTDFTSHLEKNKHFICFLFYFGQF